jgi:type II secretion system protein D
MKKADANYTASMLQQLFLGTGGARTGTTPGALGGPLAGPGALGAAGTGQARPLVFTLGGTTPEGAPIIDLRVGVDDRTNSLIVGGSVNDLDVIEAIVNNLDANPVSQRRWTTYRLKNAQVADLSAPLTDFITKELNVYTTATQLYNYQEVQRNIIISIEPITNTLLIGATQEYFEKLMALIVNLDMLPPQVMVAAMIIEVDYTGTEEFGVEIGLQSPVFFRRGLTTSDGFTVNTAVAPNPGFNFNSTNPLPNVTGTGIGNPGTVGFQGLGNLGVGRASSTSGIGGFVFSAASQSFNLLVRALATQGRVDILSRPSIMTTDNQAARILIGQSFPYISGSVNTVATTGIPSVTNTVLYRDIGVSLQVTPKINPDGTVVMRVIPEVSKTSATSIQISNGVFATAFDVQSVETTVIAQDGETVVIGGLIQKKNTTAENKIPWFGDLPVVGALFRYRTMDKARTELIVILTPHIVRCKEDADRIFALESRRVDVSLGDVLKMHGTSGMAPMLPQPGEGRGCDSCGNGNGDKGNPSYQVPGMAPPMPAGPEMSPMPRQLPPASQPTSQVQPQQMPANNPQAGPVLVPASVPTAAEQLQAASMQRLQPQPYPGNSPSQAGPVLSPAAAPASGQPVYQGGYVPANVIQIPMVPPERRQ